MKFEAGRVHKQFITYLKENGIPFEHGKNSVTVLGGNVYFYSLTTLPKGVEFNNKGGVYFRSLASPHQTYRGKKVKLINIDGYTMLVTSEKTQGEYSICKAKYFGGGDILKLKSCFLASKDNVWAHGNTVKSAIEDIQFKLIEQSNKQEIIHKIKSSKVVTVNDFRVLTGACREGIRQHLSNLGIDMDSVESLSINGAIEAMKGSSFGDAFISEIGDVS